MNTSGTITIEWENGTKSSFKCDRITLDARIDHNMIYSSIGSLSHMEMGVRWIQIQASDRSEVGKIFYEKGSKLEQFDTKKTSAMFCEHANESPYNCPCNSNCYCKDHSCKNKKD